MSGRGWPRVSRPFSNAYGSTCRGRRSTLSLKWRQQSVLTACRTISLVQGDAELSTTATNIEILTSGYQGEHLDAFVGKLLAARVTLLVDVRRRAQSRKPGFSKSALRDALNQAGIEYVHLQYLGMPDELMPLRNSHDNTPILEEYRRRMCQNEEALDPLRELLSNHRICLLCFEADHRQCHRHVISDMLDVETRHL